METLVYVSDFDLCFEPLKKYRNLKKILIVDKNYKDHGEIPEGYFDRIHVINNIHNIEEYDDFLKGENIKAILSPAESVITIGGYLRSKYGIPGMQAEQAEAVRNKWMMKKIIREKGIRTCQSKVAYNHMDFKSFINTVGYPIIAKPISGMGTMDTFKITNVDELNKYERDYWSTEQPTLLEEFVDGKEFHCDSIVVNGEIVFSSVGEYAYNCIDAAQYGKPLSSIIYPKQDDDRSLIRNIKLTNTQVIEALNIKNSVCHLEVFLKPNGDILFGEIAARIGGKDVMPQCIKNSHGVDMADSLVDLELGNCQLNNIREVGLYTGFICFPSFDGVVKKISKEEDFADIEGLLEVKINYHEGQKVKAVNDTRTRSGYAIVEGNDFDSLKRLLLEMYYNFELEVV